jgi:hypothetical protein
MPPPAAIEALGAIMPKWMFNKQNIRMAIGRSVSR